VRQLRASRLILRSRPTPTLAVDPPVILSEGRGSGRERRIPARTTAQSRRLRGDPSLPSGPPAPRSTHRRDIQRSTDRHVHDGYPPLNAGRITVSNATMRTSPRHFPSRLRVSPSLKVAQRAVASSDNSWRHDLILRSHQPDRPSLRINSKDYPPLNAGRITISDPSRTGVAKPSVKRMHSPSTKRLR
jgi:hypothetical protein